MKIAAGSDHGGFKLKQQIICHLEKKGIETIDCGIYSCESADYPDYAKIVARHIISGEAEFGIMICGTGVGISISANKINGIRCALCTDPYMAKMARMHNNANVLALGGRVIGTGLALDIVDTFLLVDFESGGRHEKRVEKIMELEK